MKRSMKWLIGVGAVTALILFWNFTRVSYPVSSRLSEDSRNSKVSIWAHHRYGLVSSELVIDLRSVDGHAANADVLRALFQSAEALKDKQFRNVVLAHRGTPKLMLKGDYYRLIGQEYENQNPIYMMRTLPQNVYKLDGSAAYATWTGGMLGVLARQMEDLNAFAGDWYLNDMRKN